MFKTLYKRILIARIQFNSMMTRLCLHESKRYLQLNKEWTSEAEKYVTRARRLIERLEED